jgi:serine/threonine protein kinase
LILVFYSQAQGLWKIGGFSFTQEILGTAIHIDGGEGDPEELQQSPTSRGTPGYRAPELILEHGVYTTKVDIWALGCILIDLFSGSKAFTSDIAVIVFYLRSDARPPIPTISWPPFLLSHLQEISSELLAKDWGERPRAAEASLLFLSYRQLLDPQIAVALTQAQYLPAYHEWKEMVFRYSSELELLSELAEIYGRMGHNDAAITIWKELVHRYPSQRQLPEILADMYAKKGDAAAAVSGWSELVEKHPNDELLAFYLEKARDI